MNKFNLKIRQRFYERLVIRIEYDGKVCHQQFEKKLMFQQWIEILINHSENLAKWLKYLLMLIVDQ